MYEYNQPTLWHRTGAPARVAAAVDSRLAVHGLASVAAAEHATVPAVNPRRLLTESRCHRLASLHRRCDWTRDEMLELRRRRYDCRRIRDARATGRHDWSCDAKRRAPLLQRIGRGGGREITGHGQLFPQAGRSVGIGQRRGGCACSRWTATARLLWRDGGSPVGLHTRSL